MNSPWYLIGGLLFIGACAYFSQFFHWKTDYVRAMIGRGVDVCDAIRLSNTYRWRYLWNKPREAAKLDYLAVLG